MPRNLKLEKFLENMQQVKASKILFLFTKKIVWKDRSLKTVAKKSLFLLFFEPWLFLNRFYRREISKIKQAKNLWFSFLEKNSKDDDISEQLVTDLKCLLRSEVESNLRSHELTLNKTNSKSNHFQPPPISNKNGRRIRVNESNENWNGAPTFWSLLSL